MAQEEEAEEGRGLAVVVRAVGPVAQRIHVVDDLVALVDRAVAVDEVVREQRVVDEVRRVEEHGIGRVARAVRVAPEGAAVDRVGGEARPVHDGHLPEVAPAVHRPLVRLDRVGDLFVRVGRGGLDHVPVERVAARVGFGEVLVASLLRLVEAPVLAVDEEVVVAAARVEVAHRALRVAAEDLVDERLAAAAFVRPGKVLRAAQVELVVGAGLLPAGVVAREHLGLEAAHAVGAAEEEAQRVLRVVVLAAPAAAKASCASPRVATESACACASSVALVVPVQVPWPATARSEPSVGQDS